MLYLTAMYTQCKKPIRSFWDLSYFNLTLARTAYLLGESAGRYALVEPVDEVVQVAARLPHHTDPVTLSCAGVNIKAGVYKVPSNLIFFPNLKLKNLIFFLKISVPFPSSPLDNLPYILNIIEQMILLLPLTLFST